MSQDERRLLAVTASAALGLLVMLFVLWPAPASVLFLGLVTGSLSALTAMGIVLVYRANKIVNFAQASLGAIAAVLAASLIAGPGWNFWLASAAGLLAALALGGLVEVAFIRRFAALAPPRAHRRDHRHRPAVRRRRAVRPEAVRPRRDPPARSPSSGPSTGPRSCSTAGTCW